MTQDAWAQLEGARNRRCEEALQRVDQRSAPESGARDALRVQ